MVILFIGIFFIIQPGMANSELVETLNESMEGSDEETPLQDSDNNSLKSYSSIQVTTEKDTVLRGEGYFTVNIQGVPNEDYYIWVKGTASMSGFEKDQPPHIVSPQNNVTMDPLLGPYTIGSYQYEGGAGRSISNDVPSSSFIENGVTCYAKIHTNDFGTCSVKFDVLNADDQTFTIRVERRIDNYQFEGDEVTVTVNPGVVIIDDMGDQNFSLGENIRLSGTDTESNTIYLFITGPDLPFNGGLLTDPKIPVNPYTEPPVFTHVDVKVDDRWEYTWETSNLEIEAGTYTVFAVSQPHDLDYLFDTPFDASSIILHKRDLPDDENFNLTVSVEVFDDEILPQNPFVSTVYGPPFEQCVIWIEPSSEQSGLSNVPLIFANQYGVERGAEIAGNHIISGSNGLSVKENTTEPDHYALVTLSPTGMRTVTWQTTKNTPSGSYTIRAEQINNEISTVKNAIVTVKDCEIEFDNLEDQIYDFGQEVSLSGKNSNSDKVFLYITGPNLPIPGGLLTDPRISVNPYAEPPIFTLVDVKADDTWEYIWETSNLSIDSGSYTLYAVSSPTDRSRLEDPYEDIHYTSLNLTLGNPIIPDVSLDRTVTQGDSLFIEGLADTVPSSGVAFWIFGQNFLVHTTEKVNSDGSFRTELDGVTTIEMSPGIYQVIIQQPMENDRFDIYPKADGNYLYRYVVESGQYANPLFTLDGPGSVESFYAAERIMTTLDDPQYDDKYTSFWFSVEYPKTVIPDIGVKNVGDKFTITGETNIAPGNNLLIELYRSSDHPLKPDEIGGTTGITKVIEGSNNQNHFSFHVDTNSFKSDEYILTIRDIASVRSLFFIPFEKSIYNYYIGTTYEYYTDFSVFDVVGTTGPSTLNPTITSLNPSSISKGSEGFTLEVTGTSFVNGAKILWDGHEKVTAFVSETQLTAVILKEDVANAGVCKIKVVNPDGKASGEMSFEVTATQIEDSSWFKVSHPAGAYILNDLTNRHPFFGIDVDFVVPLAKFGDKGESIKKIQIILNSNPATQINVEGAGSPFDETINYGENTSESVKKLQSFYGISPSGDVDTATMNILNDIAEQLKHKPKKHVPQGWILLNLNEKQGEYVKVRDTTDEVEGWVKENYISTTSDPTDLNRIKIAYSGLYDLPESSFRFDNNQPIEGKQIALLQTILYEKGFFGYKYGATGSYGPITKEALLNYLNIPPDQREIWEWNQDCADEINQWLNNGGAALINSKYSKESRKSIVISELNSNVKKFEKLSDFPKELVYAILLNEVSSTYYYDNEIISNNQTKYDDWGRGLKQIDTDSYVGTWSGLRYFYTENEIDGYDSISLTKSKCRKSLWKKPELPNPTTCTLCTQLDTYYHWHCDDCQHYYTNSVQGISANLMDGLGVIVYKSEQNQKSAVIAPTENLDQQEITQFLTILSYNGGLDYLYSTRNNLDHVKTNFGEIDTTIDSNKIEELKTKLSIFINLYKTAIKKSPGEIRIIDEYGRISGEENGSIILDIPNSIYFPEMKGVAVIYPIQNFTAIFVGNAYGSYGIDVTRVLNDTPISFHGENISIQPNDIHKFDFNWENLKDQKDGTIISIDDSGDGVIDQIIIKGTLWAPMDCSFVIQNYSGVSPLTYTFTDTSTSNITSRLWSFGDGTFAENVTEITHTYTTYGNYTVILTVSGPDGEDTSSQVITVIPPSIPPEGITNLHNTTYLSDSITWTWADPASTDFHHVMVYLDGIFNTNVTAGVEEFTANGLSSATEYTIGTRTVGANGLFNTTWVNQTAKTAATSGSDVTTPEADFIANVTYAKAPLVVQFTDQSLGYPISSWAWDFGDGANSTEQNPIHTYTNYGTYNVSLTVTNAVGEDTITKNDYIQVIPMVGGDKGYYLIHCNVEGAKVYFDEDYKGDIINGTLLVKIYLTTTPYHRYSVSKAGYVTVNEALPTYPAKDETKDIFVTLVDVTDGSWTRPPYPEVTRIQPGYPDSNWTRPPYPEVTRIQPGYPDSNWTRPAYLDWIWNRSSFHNFFKEMFDLQ